MNNKRKLLLWWITSFVLALIVLLYLSKKYCMPYFENNSYYNNLDRILGALEGGYDIDTIRGNNHGPLYMILLGHFGDFLRVYKAYKIAFCFQFGMSVLSLSVFSTILFYWSEYSVPIAGIMYTISMRVTLPDMFINPNSKYSYWAGMAFALMCIPLVIQLAVKKHEEKQYCETPVLVLILLIMSLENIIRQHFALPIMAALMLFLFELLIKNKSKRLIIFIEIIVVAVAFFYVPPAAKTLYDVAIGKIDIQTVERPWHGIWCGLGVYDNPYGFVWDDSCADNYVKSVNPDAVYCTDPYYDILRDRVIEVIKEDPIWVAKVYIRKLIASIYICLIGWKKKLFIILGINAILMKISGNRESQIDVFAKYGIVYAIVGILVGTAQGVIGYMDERYIMPAIACRDILFIVCALECILLTKRLMLDRIRRD